MMTVMLRRTEETNFFVMCNVWKLFVIQALPRVSLKKLTILWGREVKKGRS